MANVPKSTSTSQPTTDQRIDDQSERGDRGSEFLGIRLAARRRQRRWPQMFGWLTALVALAALSYVFVARPWHLRWGATPAEIARSLPGDDVVAKPVLVANRAITIAAPVDQVWPWIAQIGQGRGGFYSYDWLENLAGCDIHSADAILPDFQSPKAGDEVRMYKQGGGPPPFTVDRVEPGHALVLRGGTIYSWDFFVEPIDSKTTRLQIRSRSYSDPAWVASLTGVEPISFVMERKMLFGIKQRAEAAVQTR